MAKCDYCNKEIEYKEMEIVKGTTIKIPRHSCKEREKYIANRDFEKKKERVEKLLEYSHIDKYWVENNFKVYSEQLKDLCRSLEWVSKGKQILIYGKPGNHKTGQVTAIAKYLIQNDYKVLYFRATELPFKFDEFQYMKKCSVLVIDNFGLESNEGARGTMFDILDYRVHNYKSTIIIANGDSEEADTIFKSPLMSRLKCFDKIMLDGKDKRINIKFEKED
jgi:DNA replication protein DnaC